MLTTNYVKGFGPLDAKMWCYGEAPGKDEDRAPDQGPFTGSAGGMLDRILRAVPLLRSEIRLENIFPRRPPRNDALYFFKDSKMDYLTDEGLQYVEETRRHLAEHRPNLVVAFGAVAMKILTGKRRITKWRGSVLPCILVPGLKVYCTYHPS